MKKILLILLIVFAGYGGVKVKAALSVDAASVILMEKDSARILYGKNIEERYLTASITKIMTAVVAIEHGDLDQYCIVDNATIRQIGSCIYMQLGDRIKLIDLIYGLMLRSGNDAAYLIATNVGRNYDEFIYLMNETAKKIGMHSSCFSNPSGLDDESANYSSAYDMALLMAYALNNKIFRKITSTKKYVAKTSDGNHLYFINKHQLIQSLDYVTGGKTGYTMRAKRTLVTSAQRDGMELIVVTFNCGNDWAVHKNLFEYGYANYKIATIIKRQIIKVNDYLYPATPMINDDIRYPIKEGEKLTCIIYLLKKPLNNLIVGKAVLYLDGVEVFKTDIYRYY
ncbi:MAG: serine hydrolase [Bacilli bacterium]|nr:serine hydrolase [Bacilli bacterium]MDD4076911.1 serine hydrolase [Bacilli bacterium]MDD4388889.1 serine hydrolase [Bacilli bacterium]